MTEAVVTAVSQPSRWAVATYRVVGVVFAAAVTIQVFLAGLAVFTDPVHWERHRSFAHAFELLPLVMLIVAFAGRLPTRLRWAAGIQLLLIVVQYATANIGSAVAAAHPVNAMVIFWLALTSVRWAAAGSAPMMRKP